MAAMDFGIDEKMIKLMNVRSDIKKELFAYLDQSPRLHTVCIA